MLELMVLRLVRLLPFDVPTHPFRQGPTHPYSNSFAHIRYGHPSPYPITISFASISLLDAWESAYQYETAG